MPAEPKVPQGRLPSAFSALARRIDGLFTLRESAAYAGRTLLGVETLEQRALFSVTLVPLDPTHLVHVTGPDGGPSQPSDNPIVTQVGNLNDLQDKSGGGVPSLPVVPPPAPPQPVVVPPAVFPAPGPPVPKVFDKIEDITGVLKKDMPRRTLPGDPPPKPTAGSLLDEFEKAGGKVESGPSPSGGQINFPVKPGDKPVIVIDPTKVVDKSDAISILIFELVRFKYQGEQTELDKKAKEGKMTPDEYATECERNAYNYVKIQHQIVLNATANGKLDIKTDRYEIIMREYPTFELYLQAQKESGHYQHARDKAEAWQK